LAATGVARADEKPTARSNAELGCSARHTAFIADIGTVLRLTPHDDLQIASGDGVYCSSDDRTPFYFRVQGHLYDGQLFYGVTVHELEVGGSRCSPLDATLDVR
jgi:hypothetical protein